MYSLVFLTGTRNRVAEWNHKLDIQIFSFVANHFEQKKFPPCLNSYLFVWFFLEAKINDVAKTTVIFLLRVDSHPNF